MLLLKISIFVFKLRYQTLILFKTDYNEHKKTRIIFFNFDTIFNTQKCASTTYNTPFLIRTSYLNEDSKIFIIQMFY